MHTTAIAPMRSLLRVCGDVACKQKEKNLLRKIIVDKKGNSSFKRANKKEVFSF